MRVARLYVERSLSDGAEIDLDATAAHYILRVLRLKAGAQLAIFDGSGRQCPATLLHATRHGARIALGDCTVASTESPLSLTLVQGVSRGERMDLVMQKATELGVSAIVPVLTERSVVRLDAARAQRRSEHWRRIVIGACEQSGRVRVPALSAPTGFDDWVATAGASASGARLLLQPGADVYPGELPQPQSLEATLAIGPEGGFSPRERELLAQNDYTAVTLGPRILRTETAAIALLAMLQALWGDAGRRRHN